MYVCMYVCVYVCMYVCMIYIYIYIYAMDMRNTFSITPGDLYNNHRGKPGSIRKPGSPVPDRITYIDFFPSKHIKALCV
jgi:hypothetical protein